MDFGIKKETLCVQSASVELYCSIYKSVEVGTRAALLYFHGGGLVSGRRDDLPDYHLNRLCGAGIAVISFDYHLAPAAKLPALCSDVDTAVAWFLSMRSQLFGFPCPYFLWGRSAGAYLALLAGLRIIGTEQEPPRGILSYYGYGFLEDFWYREPSPHYQKFPQLDGTTLEKLTGYGDCVGADVEERYALYLNARQTGSWIPLFFNGKEKELLSHYSFRGAKVDKYPPTLLAHSIRDPDVPFAESGALSRLLPTAVLFTSTLPCHDFDSCTDAFTTVDLLQKTIQFIEKYSI